MRRRVAALLGALLAGAGAIPSAGAQSLAITDADVVDVEQGITRPGTTVLVPGDRITTVAPSARTAVPAGATVIEGRGRFLIPGLRDNARAPVPRRRAA